MSPRCKALRHLGAACLSALLVSCLTSPGIRFEVRRAPSVSIQETHAFSDAEIRGARELVSAFAQRNGFEPDVSPLPKDPGIPLGEDWSIPTEDGKSSHYALVLMVSNDRRTMWIGIQDWQAVGKESKDSELRRLDGELYDELVSRFGATAVTRHATDVSVWRSP